MTTSSTAVRSFEIAITRAVHRTQTTFIEVEATDEQAAIDLAAKAFDDGEVDGWVDDPDGYDSIGDPHYAATELAEASPPLFGQ